jgi:CPA1 family monovalent cation:H+ antiporter|tara:strand:- start:2817 stop:4043 length:1227 start_codon:yes stop_codon:yes gene_type:complete
MGQVLAISGLAVVGLLMQRLLRIELTLACLLVGFLAGLGLEFTGFDTGIRASNLHDLVFFVILPVLIFEAAWELNPGLLKKWLLPILLMATLGVLLCTFITAGLIYLGIGQAEGFPWVAALLTGTILAATDPVAVIAQLRSAKVSADLTTIFEGESLFNDATAVVLFSIVIGLATNSVEAGDSNLAFFSLVAVGGLVFGAIAGLVVSAVVLLVGSSIASRFILVFSAFASFFVAEHVLHISGILAVMMTAIVSRFTLREVETTVAEGIAGTWEWLGIYFNCILFAIMGLVVTLAMFRDQWVAMLGAIAAAIIARVVAVGVSCLCARPLSTPISLAWQGLLVWGGLRGAIAIALVLSLPTSLPYWWTIQSMVFGVVLFSLLVQGTTNPYLIARVVGSPLTTSTNTSEGG